MPVHGQPGQRYVYRVDTLATMPFDEDCLQWTHVLREDEMNNIKRFYGVYLGTLTGLWLFAEMMAWSAPASFFAWRTVGMQYSGVLGIGVMSAAMVLAVRPVVFEPYLGGLDKMYRLHKWLGISGLVISVSHWLLAQGPKWVVGWGWLRRAARALNCSTLRCSSSFWGSAASPRAWVNGRFMLLHC